MKVLLQIKAFLWFLVFEMASSFSPHTTKYMIISSRTTFRTNTPFISQAKFLDPCKLFQSSLASRVPGKRYVFTRNQETNVESSESPETIIDESNQQKNKSFSDIISDKVGQIDETRLAFPEIANGEVDRVFSNISYESNYIDGKKKSKAYRNQGSTLGATALIAGTTIGAGVLALPTATAPSGFLPSSGALIVAWFYMLISGLLIAELSINRMGETGRYGVGLLDLYKSNLGEKLGWVGSGAYFFLHYAVMVAYMAQGGANLGSILQHFGVDTMSVHGLDQALFAAAVGGSVYFMRPNLVEKINNLLVAGVIASFLGIIAIGAQSADFTSLVAMENQHPEFVADAFPICFLSLVYHNVVPTVVVQLEGDRKKITTSMIAGTVVPLVMFLAWNAVILGNVIGSNGGLEKGIDPIALLKSDGIGGETLSTLVTSFSELAVTTSLIGFIYGLLDGLTDIAGLPIKGPKFDQWKPLLFTGVLSPPLLLSLGNPDIFYSALDSAGAFGVSTLFLVLPPIMIWKYRYGEENQTKPLTTKPMVPFGKIPLAGLWKAAATLIVEQGADKLGLIDYVKHFFDGR
jgi:tyrosine-specific transport protein